MPSQIEILRKEHAERKETMKSTNMQKLYAKYGGEDHVDVPDELKMTMVENEFFPEQPQGLSAIGTELSGLNGIKTKYNEDVMLGGHASVWGSTFDIVEKRWGYLCCLSFDKSNERCLGEAGRNKVLRAREEVKRQAQEIIEAEERRKQKEEEDAKRAESS